VLSRSPDPFGDSGMRTNLALIGPIPSICASSELRLIIITNHKEVVLRCREESCSKPFGAERF